MSPSPAAIAIEVQEKGLGFNAGGQLLEDVFCVPPTFGRDLSEAIRTLAPRTEWDYGHIGILGKGVKAERPKLRAPQQMRLPRFPSSPPVGYSGRWDLINDRPLDD